MKNIEANWGLLSFLFILCLVCKLLRQSVEMVIIPHLEGIGTDEAMRLIHDEIWQMRCILLNLGHGHNVLVSANRLNCELLVYKRKLLGLQHVVLWMSRVAQYARQLRQCRKALGVIQRHLELTVRYKNRHVRRMACLREELQSLADDVLRIVTVLVARAHQLNSKDLLKQVARYSRSAFALRYCNQCSPERHQAFLDCKSMVLNMLKWSKEQLNGL